MTSRLDRLGWLTLAVLLSAAPASAEDLQGILGQYMAQSVRAEYAGVQQIADYQTDGQRIVVQAFTHCKAGRERQKFDRHRYYGGTVLGEQDGYKIIYVPHEKRLYRFRGVPTSQQRADLLRRRLSFFDISLDGTETVAGRRAYRLRLSPRRPPQGGPAFGPSGTLWVDSERYVKLGMQFRFGNFVAYDARFTRIDYRSVDDDELRFDPPDGTTTIDMPSPPMPGPPRGRGHDGGRDRDGRERGSRPVPPPPFAYASAAALRRATGLRVYVLHRLPEGFHADGIAHHPPEPEGVFRRRISVRYSNDQSYLLLAMGNLPGEGPVSETPREVRPRMFYWRRGPVHLALIGPREVASEILRACADSVDWAD